MTYIEFIVELVKQYDVRSPIYTVELTNKMIENYPWEKTNLDKKRVAAIVSATIQRIHQQKIIPELRNFQKGIWYRTMDGVFGEVGIKKDDIAYHKYIANDNGYIAGYEAACRIGLTTQIPNEKVIVTNKTKRSQIKDKDLGVTIKPPKTQITKINKHYLQLLDVIDVMDKIIITHHEPYKLLIDIMDKHNLKYEVLLGIASKYYHKSVIKHILRMTEVFMEYNNEIA